MVEGIAGELEQAGVEAARTEAERLVSATLGLARAELTTAGGERVDPEDAVAVARAVSRRLHGEPLQHIEGSVDFRRLVLVSDGRALVPRPETEQLVDLVASEVAGRTPLERVLEIGVGSGAIALSLLSEGLADRVIALDTSPRALDQARENAATHDLLDRLALVQCSAAIWPDLTDEGPFDALVSNPPYVATADVAELATEVRDHEPRPALDGGEDGLDVIRTILDGAPEALRDGAPLFLEIGADQGPAVSRLLKTDRRWEGASIRRDLAGRDRFATARRRPRRASPE